MTLCQFLIMAAAATTLEEEYGKGSLHRKYARSHDQVRRLREIKPWSIIIFNFIKEAFLPQGYPQSVSKDYLVYQFWDTIQAFCSSITGALATVAILKGVGVGDSSATPLAAALTWMMKDGTGMMGRIMFAWLVATDLDCNAKFWRLVADILCDLANFLELLAPLFPSIFLPIVCCASVAKAIVGSAGGATRAALVQHQARRDNMADVAAKDGSQETVVNLVALLVNMILTPLVSGHTELVWTLFIFFTLCHLLANHRAVSVVSMETLNQGRLHLLMELYLSKGTVPTVDRINFREPILSRSGRLLTYSLGVSLSDVLTSGRDYEEAERGWREGEKIILLYKHSSHRVGIALERSSGVSIQLKAAMAVEVVDYLLRSNWSVEGPILSPYHKTIQQLKGDIPGSLVFAQSIMDQLYPDLHRSLAREGWVTSHLLLGTGEWRYSWNTAEARKTL